MGFPLGMQSNGLIFNLTTGNILAFNIPSYHLTIRTKCLNQLLIKVNILIYTLLHIFTYIVVYPPPLKYFSQKYGYY